MDKCFELSIADGVAHLILARGEAHNTMTADFWREFPALVRDLDENARARVLVISSTGKHFSAGMDLSVFAAGAGHLPDAESGRARLHLRQSVLALQESFTALERARLPVLAAIQGGCIGAALDMVSACDCRYASEDAYFVIQEINLGLTADLGTFPRLGRLMAEGMVREMAYSGRKLSAGRARKLGLVNDVFDSREEMLEAVMTLAREIAAKSPLAVAGSKAMLNYARDHSVADTLDHVATWQAGMYNPQNDMAEALAAKREGREARFADLPPVSKPFD